MVPGFLGILKSRSALAELRCATSGFEAVLLTLLHTRIAGQEASAFFRAARNSAFASSRARADTVAQ